MESLGKKQIIEERQQVRPQPEQETIVYVDDVYEGECPKCGEDFNYDSEDVGRLVRCRLCGSLLRIQLKKSES
jgi:DNA-directed RNA polymerase subunit RPC12/RpoP